MSPESSAPKPKPAAAPAETGALTAKAITRLVFTMGATAMELPAQRHAEFTEQVAEVNQRLNELVYPSSVESQAAGTDAQQRVRQLFTSAGLNLASRQMLEPKVEGSFDRIPLTVRLDGDLVALQTALNGLDTLRPVIWVDNLSVQTGVTPRDQAPRLNIALNLSVLRGRP